MRHYNDLAIVTRIYTACCGAYALSADGQRRLKPSQVAQGESLTCEGCGEEGCEVVEEEDALEE